MPRATAVAIALLAISVLVSFFFVVQNGGLLLPEAAVPGASVAAGAGVQPGASAGASAGDSAGGSAGASASPAVVAGGGPVASGSPGSAAGGPGAGGGTASGGGAAPGASSPAASAAGGSAAGGSAPAGSAAPARTPRPSVRPSAAPVRTAAPPVAGSPSAGRLALLTPCPGRADCYVYVVRSGDNLFSIANYFGVPLGRVRALNPGFGGGSIVQPGTKLILPTPTR